MLKVVQSKDKAVGSLRLPDLRIIRRTSGGVHLCKGPVHIPFDVLHVGIRKDVIQLAEDVVTDLCPAQIQH